MDITPIIQAIQQHAEWVVFVSVLMQQVGLPVPAVPTLLVAGSLVFHGKTVRRFLPFVERLAYYSRIPGKLLRPPQKAPAVPSAGLVQIKRD